MRLKLADLQSQSFRRFRVAGRELNIEQQYEAMCADRHDGTGAVIWTGSVLLAYLLELFPEIVRNKRVLDIGCGSGLVCLVAALHGASEILGLDMNVEHARRTVSSNHDALPASCHLHFVEYKFGEPMDVIPDLLTNPDFVIFCSDVLYRSTAPEELLPTMVKLLELRLSALDDLCRMSDIVRCNLVSQSLSDSLPSFFLSPSSEYSRLLRSICAFICYPERSADFADAFLKLVEQKRIFAPSRAAEIRCLRLNMHAVQASILSQFSELFDVGNPNLHVVGLIVCEVESQRDSP